MDRRAKIGNVDETTMEVERGHLGQDHLDSTTGTGKPGQDSFNRSAQQVSLDRSAWEGKR
jgi:hypothetical protein